MKRVLIKSYGPDGPIFIKKDYQPAVLSYQEMKTEWGNKKRKVKWNLDTRNIKSKK